MKSMIRRLCREAVIFMLTGLVLVGVDSFMTGCSRPHPIIAINVARDEAYAKGVCDFFAASGRPCDFSANESAGEIDRAFRTRTTASLRDLDEPPLAPPIGVKPKCEPIYGRTSKLSVKRS